MSVRINVLVSEEMARAIDDWRRAQLDLPSRAEALRQLTAERLGKPELAVLPPREDVRLNGEASASHLGAERSPSGRSRRIPERQLIAWSGSGLG